MLIQSMNFCLYNFIISRFDDFTISPTTTKMKRQVNLAEFLEYIKGSELDLPVDKIVEKMKKPPKILRKSYTREFKLQTLKLLKTGRIQRAGQWVQISKREVARSAGIAPNTLRDWEKTAEKIVKAPKGSRRLYEATRTGNRAGRAAFWPEMEKVLVQEFTIARGKGISINRGWFLRLVHNCNFFITFIN